MNGIERLARALGALSTQSATAHQNTFRDSFVARLGKGDGVTITAPDDPTKDAKIKVWYHTDQGRRGTAILLGSAAIPYANSSAYHGVEVMVGRPPASLGFGDQECIFGVGGTTGAISGGGTSLIYNIINNCTINPAAAQIRTLRLEPSADGGLKVQVVGPYNYPKNDASQQILTYKTANLDLTSYIPTSGKHRIGIVYLDPIANTLGIVASTAIVSGTLPNRTAFTILDVAGLDVSKYIPSGVVYLYYGQTEITTDDILNDKFEVRSLFYPPKLKKTPPVAGTYTSPASITISPSGEVEAITSGTAIGPGGATTKTVKFKPSIDKELFPNTSGGLLLDSAVTNDDTAGAYSAPYFEFTPPSTALYRIRVSLDFNAGSYSNIAVFKVSYFKVADGPTSTQTYILTVNASTFDAGAGPYIGTISQTLNVGETIALKYEYIDLGGVSRQVEAATTYVEIVSTPPAATLFGPQPAHTVLAGPTSGGDVPPTFRALAADDLPAGATFTVKVPFDHTTTFPLTLHTAGVNGADVTEAQVYIGTAFNGSTTLSIGDSGNNSRLVATGDLAAGRADTVFVVEPVPYHYGAGDIIKLYKPAGTPSAGSGVITLTLKG